MIEIFFEKLPLENARKVKYLLAKGHVPVWNLGTLPKKWYFVPKIVENARKVAFFQSKGPIRK